MAWKWITCDECGRKYQNEEKHYLKYHTRDKSIIPYEDYSTVQDLLRRSKLQVVKQKPDLLIKIAPFIHRDVVINDDITLEIGKLYKVMER